MAAVTLTSCAGTERATERATLAAAAQQDAGSDSTSGAVDGTDDPAGREARSLIERSLEHGSAALELLPNPEDSGLRGGAATTAGAQADEADGSFVVAPIPFANPTIGAGLALGTAYLVKLDPDSPPSTIGGGAMYSDNDSFAAALGIKAYFGADKYRVTAAVGKARLNFGLSTDTGTVPLQEGIVGGSIELLVRSFENVYIGPSFLAYGVDTRVVLEGSGESPPPDELVADNNGVGLHVLRDTRDNTFYPRSGSLADAEIRAFIPALGADFSSQVVPISYNHYLSLGERDVLALRAAARFAVGDVPFYLRSYLGSGPDLRGYAIGTVSDDVLLAVQAEYRRELFWRLGAVGFAGVGTVLPDLNALDDAKAYPSLGVGLRLLLEKKNHLNFRVDFAWGDDQSAVYVSVGEAF